jgi:diaminohydroxyphosphoribosylaminopyrimidine deaminase/5-amino-6-(5-phosphoribosylamino)uracil reductase
VLVGAETVRADNPRLTLRSVRPARQPWRIVLTRSGQLPRQARVLSDKFAARTLIYKRKSLASVLKDLGKRGITSVLIEGGGEVLGEALDKRLIDKVQIYLGPILTGGPVIAFPGEGVEKTADALRLCEIEYRQIGQTVSISGYPDVLGRE